MGGGMVAVGVVEDLVGDRGGAVEVAFEHLHLSELQAGQLRGRTAENVAAALGQKAIC